MALSLLRNTDQVMFEETLGTRKVILNRPEKLNSLNYEMVSQMSSKLKAYENDPTVKLVILKGNGKAFCVGGDIVSSINFIITGHWSFCATFHKKQVILDYILATYKKPLVVVLNGSVMGGGAGISMNATFRIVTENTIFAMPEAAIGHFPDVGASHFLSRLPGFFGEYVGLAGARLDGTEMLACGLGTHFVLSEDLQSLEKELETMVLLGTSNTTTIAMVINKFRKEVGIKQESAYTRLDMVNKCFCRDSCEDILSSLEQLALHVKEKWVDDAIRAMKSASPLSLKIFLRTIREGRSQKLSQCLAREYLALCHILRRTINDDFYEGTRAMLIDKDKKPQWTPSKLELVTDEMVDKCFMRAFNEDDNWEPLLLPARSDKSYAMTSRLSP